MGMLTPNFSDTLLVFLYGVMGTLFVQWVVGMFRFEGRVEPLEAALYEASSRLRDCEVDIRYCRYEVLRLAEKERDRERAERPTRARSPRRAKK